MSIEVVLDVLRCPVCAAELGLVGRTVRCGAGHAYDLARQGYLNLLGRGAPANADTAAMVAARTRFLSSGAYDLLAGAIAATVRAGLPRGPITVLDAGAGPGHHLARVLEATSGRGLALDVSVPAARQAARAHPRIGSVVADTWQPLPVRDSRVDAVLCVFAPRHPAEFARVLRPGGQLVTVTPEPGHLVELRTALGLLTVEEGKGERLAGTLGGHFELESTRPYAASLSLGAAALADLVQMGPNGFHLERAEIDQRVAALGARPPVGVAVTVSGWRRR